MEAEVTSSDHVDNKLDTPDPGLSWLSVQGTEPLTVPSVEPDLPLKKAELEMNPPAIGMQDEKIIDTQLEAANTQHESAIKTQHKTIFSTQHETITDTHREAATDTQPEAAINTQLETVAVIQPVTITNTQPEAVIKTQHETVTDTQSEAATDTQQETAISTQPEAVTVTQPETASDTQHEAVIKTQPETIFSTRHEPVTDTQPETATDTQYKGASDLMQHEAGSSTQEEVISSQSIGPFCSTIGIDQMTLQRDPLPTVGALKNGVIVELFMYMTQTLNTSQKAVASKVVLLSGCSTVKVDNIASLISLLMNTYKKTRKRLRAARKLHEIEHFLNKEFLLIRTRGKKKVNPPTKQRQQESEETVPTSVIESKGVKRKLESRETRLSELEMAVEKKDAFEESTAEEKVALGERTAEAEDTFEGHTVEEKDAFEERLVAEEAEQETAESEELFLQAQCKELARSQHLLLMDLRAISEKFDPTKERFAKYKQRYANTKKQLQITEEQLVIVQSRMKHSEHRNLHKKLKHSDDSFECVQAEVEKTQETIASLKEEIKTTTTQLEVCRKSLLDLETTCEMLKAGKRKYDKKLRTLRKKLENMRQKNYLT